MHINMNLTFPLADWIMGTSDLNRGLLGHLFNGYDNTFQKPELTSLIRQRRFECFATGTWRPGLSR